MTANRLRVADGDGPLPLGGVWRQRFTGEVGERIAATRRDRAGGRPAPRTPSRLSASRGRRRASPAATATRRSATSCALLDVYVGRIPDELADAEAAKYADDELDGLSFAWAGGIEAGEPHYYRVQGAATARRVRQHPARGQPRAHGVARSGTDFGDDVLLDHYRRRHPHEP